MRSIVRFADCQAKPSFTRPCLTKALSYFALFLLTLGLPFSLLASQRTHGKQWRSAKVQPETGSGATVVQLSPATVTFPAQAVSTTSNAVTVTLTANNNNGLTIGSISVTGDFAQTNTCGTGWQGGSQPGCAIYVTFKPTATGTRTGTLTVSDNGSTPAQTVTLNGTGWPAGPGATITSLGSLGSAGNYTLAATVTGMRSKGSPTGSVSFVDASNSKFSLGSNPLSASTVKLGLANGVSAPTSNEAAAVLVGDFNGDGKPDMAVLNSPIGTPCPNTAGSILVFLGKGDGTFTADGSTSVSSCVWGFVAADFNGDGRSDIAFADGKNVTVLFGNADGTFSTKSISMTNAGLAGGDLNGDGKADLVVETTGGIAVLLGQSNETFTTLSVASAPYGD
ncbi:MAG: VCBS repeat-containing protein, partial [Silvibacterium sp.]|nr:VCBS repeat-containing protein [Silvibacterium sp.]